MPGERLPQHANDFNKSDLLELLLTLQRKVNRELHVATLCIIDAKIKSYLYRAIAFPKAQGKESAVFNAICIRASDAETIDNALQADKRLICVAVMTDFDSEANYDAIAANHSFSSIDASASLHTMNNAVITCIGDATDGTRVETFFPSEA